MEEISASVVYELLQQVDKRNDDRHKSLRATLDAMSTQILRLATEQSTQTLTTNGRLVMIETQLLARRDLSNRQVAVMIPFGVAALGVIWAIVQRFLGWM